MPVKPEPIKPEKQDIEAIERKYGPLLAAASEEQRAHRYRLWQAQALLRQFVRSKTS
jgi:hypothetical protein